MFLAVLPSLTRSTKEVRQGLIINPSKIILAAAQMVWFPRLNRSDVREHFRNKGESLNPAACVTTCGVFRFKCFPKNSELSRPKPKGGWILSCIPTLSADAICSEHRPQTNADSSRFRWQNQHPSPP